MGGGKLLDFINKTFVLKIRNTNVEPTYWQAAVIVVLVFLLVWSIARIRYLYVHWSTGKSAAAFLFWGFVLAFIFQGFLLLAGRTIFTDILGIQNLPKPFSTFMSIGRSELVRVLGESEDMEDLKNIRTHNAYDLMVGYQSLKEEDKLRVYNYICEPK